MNLQKKMNTIRDGRPSTKLNAKNQPVVTLRLPNFFRITCVTLYLCSQYVEIFKIGNDIFIYECV